MQVAFPGMVVYFQETFRMIGLAAVAMTFFVTLTCVCYTPAKLFTPDKARYMRAYFVFKKVSICFVVYLVRAPAAAARLRAACLAAARPSCRRASRAWLLCPHICMCNAHSVVAAAATSARRSARP